MGSLIKTRFFFVFAVCLAIFAVPTIALTQSEKTPEDIAVEHRRALMQLIWRDFGPLLGMAKGEMEYDADAAQTHADNLHAISGYNPVALFPAGTAKPDRDGDTRALPAIWEDTAAFVGRWGDLGTAMASVSEAAGQGQETMAAAVFESGKSCGGCHDNFRAKDF